VGERASKAFCFNADRWPFVDRRSPISEASLRVLDYFTEAPPIC
jgi:hypothetical protein